MLFTISEKFFFKDMVNQQISPKLANNLKSTLVLAFGFAHFLSLSGDTY